MAMSKVKTRARIPRAAASARTEEKIRRLHRRFGGSFARHGFLRHVDPGDVPLHIDLLDFFLRLRGRLLEEQFRSGMKGRHGCLDAGKVALPGHADPVPRPAGRRHEGLRVVVHGIIGQDADSPRQGLLEGLRRLGRYDWFRQVQLHVFGAADDPHAEGRRQAVFHMGIEALGIGHGQFGPPEGAADGPQIFQVGNKPDFLILRNLKTQLHCVTSPDTV